MPRYAFALLALSSLAGSAAYGQISFNGSVRPVAPTGFPVPEDANLDGRSDFLTTAGSFIDTFGRSPTNPQGDANGLPWDTASFYANYEHDQNILVGDAQQSGSLDIDSGASLRYQHLVIGGISSNITAIGNNGVDTSPGSTNPFGPTQIDAIIGGLNIPGGGSGVVTVDGFGSLYSNDPNLIDQNIQTALILAEGLDPLTSAPIVDLNTELSGAFTFDRREFGNETDSGFDVIVGLNGSAALNVTGGGRVEIQDALMTAIGAQSVGTVTVDGVGSALVAFGRFDLDDSLVPMRSLQTASFVGGRGTGLMTVSGGGRAEFFNGLSIGEPIGVAANDDEGSGSGTVVVTGAGSILNAASSNATDFNSGGTLALRVGGLRDSLTAPFNPANAEDAELQAGLLEINAGAVVTTSAGFNDTTENDANAVIGKRGIVRLGGGQLQIGANLDNDGLVSGYGTVRARTMDTSVFSVIRGGNPNSENPELTDPLRLVLLDASDGAAGPPALRNRGLIEGRVNFDVSGTIVNEGQIETSGEIFADQLFTTVESRIRQFPGSGSPLRLRLTSDTDAGSTVAGNQGALHNRGSIEGDLDFIVAGGVVNGDNNLPFGTGTPNPSSGSASTGSISGSGRILAGTFVNHDDGEVRVGQGQSLSILTNAGNAGNTSSTAEFTPGQGLPVAGSPINVPSPVGYRTLNLGAISVDGGSLEIGYLNETGATPISFTDAAGTTFNTEEVFYNARYVVEDGAGVVTERTAGTITVNDGELRLTTGMINAGVLAFTGGDNLVHGRVYNATFDYSNGGPATVESGAIVVSGNGTTVTFEDNVVNDGIISVGPFDNVVNFLGDLDVAGPSGTGTLQFTTDIFGARESAFIQVAGSVTINGGDLVIASLVAPSATTPTDVSISLLVADDLGEDSLFTELVLPDLPDGQFWDIVYDTVNDEVRLEIIESNAFGADFNGDGIVSEDDVAVWVRNVGINSGASTIQGDADLDGDVDLADYDILMAQLFTGIPELVTTGIAFAQASVPEPTTALLLCVAAFSAGATRRR